MKDVFVFQLLLITETNMRSELLDLDQLDLEDHLDLGQLDLDDHLQDHLHADMIRVLMDQKNTLSHDEL